MFSIFAQCWNHTYLSPCVYLLTKCFPNGKSELTNEINETRWKTNSIAYKYGDTCDFEKVNKKVKQQSISCAKMAY